MNQHLSKMLAQAAAVKACKLARVSIKAALEAAEYAAGTGYSATDLADVNSELTEVIADLSAVLKALGKL